jgi:hypothetical protein
MCSCFVVGIIIKEVCHWWNLLVWTRYPGVSTCSAHPSKWITWCCGSFPGTADRQEVPVTAIILTEYLKSRQVSASIVPLRKPQLLPSKFISIHYPWLLSNVIWCYKSIISGVKTPSLNNLRINQSVNQQWYMDGSSQFLFPEPTMKVMCPCWWNQ